MVTLCPSERRCRAACPPIKPVPPTTRVFILRVVRVYSCRFDCLFFPVIICKLTLYVLIVEEYMSAARDCPSRYPSPPRLLYNFTLLPLCSFFVLNSIT
ncbi:hypothetical protein IF2G_08615 [Cordyceps javanica]|nr:hypothetical protein IF2G_08615 [Cordyceps javanica]